MELDSSTDGSHDGFIIRGLDYAGSPPFELVTPHSTGERGEESPSEGEGETGRRGDGLREDGPAGGPRGS